MRFSQIVWNVPQFDKTTVVLSHGPGHVDDQDPIARGLQSGTQLGHAVFQLFLDLALLTQVAHGDQIDRLLAAQPDPADLALDGHRHPVEVAQQGFRQDAVGQASGHVLPKKQVFRRTGQFHHRLVKKILAG